MRRLLAAALLLAVLAGLMNVSASIYDPNALTMYVKTADGKPAVLREKPNAKGKELAKIPYGAKILVYSDFVSMEWSHVQYEMFNGFIPNKLIVEKKPKPFHPPTPKPAPPTRKPVAPTHKPVKPTHKPVTPTRRPGPTPVPVPTRKPTPLPTRIPSPRDLRAAEILAARKLGLVPPGMKADGTATWDDLNTLLTNVIRLKNGNSLAQRSHVYLNLEEYLAGGAGAQFNFVLRGVAAAEIYGALMDMGIPDPAANHSNDPFIADAQEAFTTQQYAGRDVPYTPDDWRTKDLLSMIITVMDYTDASTGKGVMEMDDSHLFRPNQPLTQEDAILAAYRLYHSYSAYVGTVLVTHGRDVNLRAKPSMNADILGTTAPGTTYPVVAIEKGGWYKIQLPDSRTCYIAAGMVAFSQQ